MTTTSHQRQRRWTIAAAAAAVALSRGASAFSPPPSRPTAARRGGATTRVAEGGLLDAIGGAFDSLRRQLVGDDAGAAWRVSEETVAAASAEFEYGTMPARSAPARRAGYGKGSASWKASSAPPREYAASPAGPPVLKGAAFGGSATGPSSAAPAKSYGKGGAAKWKAAGTRPSGTILPDAMVRAAEGLASDVVSQMTGGPTAVAKSYGKGSWKAKTKAAAPAVQSAAPKAAVPSTVAKSYGKGSWKTKTAAAPARQPWEDSNAAPASPSAAELAVTAHFSAPAAAKSYAKGSYAKGSWKSSSPGPKAGASAAASAAPAAKGAASAPALKGSSSAPSKGYGKSNASWKTAAPKSGGGYLDTFSGADAVAAEMIDSSRSAATAAVASPPSGVAKSASPGPTKKYSKTNASWKDVKRADLTRKYSKTNASWKTAAPKSGGGGYLDAVAVAAPAATSAAVASPAAVEAPSPSRAGPARSYSKTSASWKTAAAGRQPWEDVNSSRPSVDLMPPPPSASAAVPKYKKGYAKGSWKASAASPSAPAAGVQAAAPAAKGSAGPKGGFGLGSWKK